MLRFQVILTADTSKTIGANFDELFEQAKKRQKQNPGTQYLGTALQHLVAAKLCLIMPEGSFEIHGASFWLTYCYNESNPNHLS